MQSRIRIGVIGVGYWGPNFVRVLSGIPQAQVTAVCDRDLSRARSVCDRFAPHARIFSKLRDTLGDSHFDAAIICTPIPTHYSMASACLRAGKHVLVEKPMALRTADADALLSLSLAAKRTLMAGHTYLYSPPVRAIRKYIEEGFAREILEVYSTRRHAWAPQGTYDVISDLAPHDLSILGYWLGALPHAIEAIGLSWCQTSNLDLVELALAYPAQIRAYIHLSWVSQVRSREMILVGNTQTLVYDDTNAQEPIKIFARRPPHLEGHGHSWPAIKRSEPYRTLSFTPSEPLREECLHFLHCIQTGETPLTGGAEGRNVTALLEAIYHAVERHGTPISIPHTRNDPTP